MVDITYRFHPVGQGLFASGRIIHNYRLHNWTPPAFSWVYDCGTSSSISKLLIPELNQFGGESMLMGNGVDLVTLSHFDSDHINGLTELLERVSVRTLLLPLIPLWKRLELAFMDSVRLDSDTMGFYLNPVAYLIKRFPERIQTIVLVPASSPPPEEFYEEINEPKPWVEAGRSYVATESKLEPEIAEELKELSQNQIRTIQQLAPAGTIQVSQFWEFMPYNDLDLCPPLPKCLVAHVRGLRDLLLRSAISKRQRSELLKEIKIHYELHTGSSAHARNRISLFLYAGPIGRVTVSKTIGSTFMRPGGVETKANINLPFSPTAQQRLSVLYTGDGYLSDQRSVDALFAYLGSSRIASLACLQVPHHGAKSNWTAGHAAQFDPHVAVFCSDPTRKNLRHPHSEVVNDFSSYSTVSVDKKRGAVIEGTLALH
ncbi:hypothetical protein JY561_04205 [Pseudomonas aeruginosa]|nr:hypothetical protein [Pseudomonas aeruginosa]